MDLLRGTAVSLVVVLHVAVVPSNLGATVPDWMIRSQYALEPYRVPTLLFLSGMLLNRSLSKSASRYIYGKLSNIVWPYFVWTFITAAILGKTELLTVPKTWLIGMNHLWFLTVLIVCYMLAPVTRWIHPALFAALFLTLIPLAPLDAAERLLRSSAFFFFGAAILPLAPRIQATGRTLGWLAGIVAFGWGAALANSPGLREINPFAEFALSTVGIVFLVWISPQLPSSMMLEYIGRNSIVLYLAHAPIIGGVWLFLDSQGVDDWSILAPTLLVLGFLVPLVITPLRRSVLFRLPLPSRSTPRTATRSSPQ
ncbi:acyltransferase family protein [Kytococcus schroeteri]|uniref:acyltransferase family protein n=1 Tax=Kytococcus schroeteri TaxID=138300 RepID=UPI0039C17A29